MKLRLAQRAEYLRILELEFQRVAFNERHLSCINLPNVVEASTSRCTFSLPVHGGTRTRVTSARCKDRVLRHACIFFSLRSALRDNVLPRPIDGVPQGSRLRRVRGIRAAVWRERVAEHSD